MKKTLLEWVKDWDKNKRRFGIKSQDEVIKFDESGMCFKQRIEGLNMFWDWELIQQPIPFLEAVKAYSGGKTIRCEQSGGMVNHFRGGTAFAQIRDENGCSPCYDRIINSKWYVEDSNE